MPPSRPTILSLLPLVACAFVTDLAPVTKILPSATTQSPIYAPSRAHPSTHSPSTAGGVYLDEFMECSDTCLGGENFECAEGWAKRACAAPDSGFMLVGPKAIECPRYNKPYQMLAKVL